MTKYQILKNILPLYDTIGISRSQYAHKGFAETYNIEVFDRISLSDSLFLAESSIVDLCKDLLQEKRGFKYTLSTKITLKICNSATNTYDIESIYFNSKAITVTDKEISLNSAYEEWNYKLDIWGEGGSGWIIEKIENIWIKISNYEPLAGSSYIPFPPKLNNSMEGLVNTKNKDIECFNPFTLGLFWRSNPCVPPLYNSRTKYGNLMKLCRPIVWPFVHI